MRELIKLQNPLYHKRTFPYKITNTVQKLRHDGETSISQSDSKCDTSLTVNVTGHDNSLTFNVTVLDTPLTVNVRDHDTSLRGKVTGHNISITMLEVMSFH